MTRVTVSDKGQVVIPATLRRNLGIKPGTELEFELEGSWIRVSLPDRVPATEIDAGYGMLRPKSVGKSRRLKDFDPALALGRPGRK